MRTALRSCSVQRDDLHRGGDVGNDGNRDMSLSERKVLGFNATLSIAEHSGRSHVKTLYRNDRMQFRGDSRDAVILRADAGQP